MKKAFQKKKAFFCTMLQSRNEISEKIKQLATELGFTACGIAPARKLTDDAERLSIWLQNGMQAGMNYMNNHYQKRIDPRQLVPGTKSVIVVVLNYYPEILQQERDNLIISKYAYGRDYHKVIRKMLKLLKKKIVENISTMEGRYFVDSAPVLERAWAAEAGLGWIGKNANLISPKHGSFLFIGELFTNLELSYDKSLPDYCGGCNKCIQACPTNAIVLDRVIDGRKCISYWTIEHKDEITRALKGKFKNRIFGCDICQDVCPWNKKVTPNTISEFEPDPDLLSMTRNDWKLMTEEQFGRLFYGSAVKRAGFKGLKRNISFADTESEA